MARRFDGVNDNIAFASDPTIDNFNPKIIAMWAMQTAVNLGGSFLLGKGTLFGTWGMRFDGSPSGSTKLQFGYDWTTADGAWEATTSTFTNAVPRHIVLTYNNGSSANDPVMVIDGVTQTLTEVLPPSGSANLDGANTLIAGEDTGGGSDLTGDIGWLVYASGTWTDVQKNIARWYGSVGRPEVYHPFETTATTNYGTATANASVTGAVMAGMARVERRYGSMMGCGR